MNHDKLRALVQAATPGPWSAYRADGKCESTGDWSAQSECIGCTQYQAVVEKTSGTVLLLVVSESSDHGAELNTDSNAAYIVAACNAVPALLDENKALREALVATRHVLEAANTQPDGPICDTIWYSGCETLFDFIDVALTKGQPS
jgi:hypothetical protein